MPESLLTVLKLIFLGLLYLFFIRVIRAVWTELREPTSVQVAVLAPSPPQRAEGRPRPNARAQPDRLMAVEPPERYGQVFTLGDELTVGRAAGCGIALADDTFVSTLHARVFRRDGSLFVEDLGSTNGTFVNDRPVSSAVPLQRGDRLQIGKTVLELNR
jgi:pSer/pThr/pTyr-binding forkhead associated (FHA) protein